jgi:hydroxylamine dehydrogenase
MMGPDYTHWHGTYEAARNFYCEFVLEAEKERRRREMEEFKKRYEQ